MVLGILLSRAGAAGTVRIQSEACGISYLAPAGWSATLSEGEGPDGLVMTCRFQLKPSNWARLDADSKWGAGEPITVDVYAPGTTLKSACESIYEQNAEGQLGIDGRFSFGVVKRYRRGEFRGYIAFGNFRGFAKEEADLSDEDGRIYTGESANIVVAASSGRVVALDHACGSPDVEIDCDGAITLLLHTLTFTPAKLTLPN